MQIQEQLSRHPGLHTLTGTGGIGKTRVAWEVLRRHAGEHQAWFCDLRAVESDAGFLAALAAKVAPVGREPASSYAELAKDLSQWPTALLVLDNFEQVLSAAAFVGALCIQLPQLRILVTSRARLGIANERVVEVSTLTPDDAVALYVRRVQELGASPGTDLLLLRRLAAQLDGLPLALELAAGRARLLSTEEIVLRTEASLALLAREGPVEDARHRTLAASIAASWDLLEPAEQHGLAACSVFAADFSIQAAEHVIGGESTERSAVDLLMALRDKSLLSASRHDGRLSLYVATRAFASERLRENSARADQTVRAHAAYFAARAHELSWSRLLHGTRSDTELRSALLRDIHDVAQAMAATRSHRTQDEASSHAALVDAIYTLHGTTPERGLELVAHALSGDGLPMWQRVRLLNSRRSMMNALGQAGDDDGMDALLLQQDMPSTLRAFLLCMRGIQLRLLGRYSEALAEHEAAASLLEGHDVPRMFAMNTACMGRLHADFGNALVSRTLNNDARAVASSVGDRWLEALTLANLAQLAQSEAQWSHAESLLKLALSLLGQTEETYYIAIYQTAGGDLMQECHRTAEARDYYMAADVFLSTWPGHRCTTLMYSAWSAMEADQGDFTRADFLLAKARLSAAGSALGNPTVTIGLALHAARVDVAHGVQGARKSASALLQQHDNTIAHSFDLRFAARMLKRTLTGPECAAQSPEEICLHITHDADTFRVSDGAIVDLRKRGAMRRIVLTFVDQHARAPGVALESSVLVASAWPDERLSDASASARLRVAISGLRKLGLRGVVLTRHEGYLLAPEVRVVHI